MSSSFAVSLGRQRGTALIGQPLDITVQAVLDDQEDISSLCLAADVFYGDTKLDGSRVRVSVDRDGPGSRDALVHVRASAVVNEPVVNLQLRIGCAQKFEKRYVVFADVLPQTGTASAAVPLVQVDPIAVAPIPSRPAFAGSSIKAGVGDAPRRPRTRARKDPDTVVPPAGARSSDANAPSIPLKEGGVVPAGKKLTRLTSPGGKAAKVTQTPGSLGSRLKLDPLDLTLERDPKLKPSQELLSVPAGTEQERSVAAALWRALSASPNDMLKNTEKLEALENTVRKLQAQNQQSQKSINELNTSLQAAQRDGNWLVYAALALLLVSLLLAAYIWRQRSGSARIDDEQLPWWKKNKVHEKGWANPGADSDIRIDGDGKLTSRKVLRKENVGGKTDLDLDLDVGVNESGFGSVNSGSFAGSPVSVMPLAPRDRSDFGVSMTHMSRAVKAEELFDVQQQADFFVSLGQHEQAIEVLRNHIDDIGQTSAMVYLDLFNLYYQLGRRAEYELLREDFNQRFNAKIPAFEQYTIGTLGLAAYSDALQRIEALWPSPRVLDVIEESIFRGSDANADAFDLEAYRELLMLYAIAKEVIGERVSGTYSDSGAYQSAASVVDEDVVRASKFSATAIQPLSAIAGDTRPPEITFDVPPAPPRASPRLGLDVDLNEFDGTDQAAVGTLDSDADFFAQFSKNTMAEIKAPDSNQASKPPEAPTDNLIDFEDFSSSIRFDHDSKAPKL